MPKYTCLLIVLVFILGCGKSTGNKVILAKINNYEISQEEFAEDFKNSIFGKEDTPESRKEFLNHLINRKLILQDAQNSGLDKDKNFLKMIERFWEQSLLTLMLDKKTKEIAGSVIVGDREIETVYNKMKTDGKTDKSYDQMYPKIKWELTRFKQTQMINEWLGSLRKNARIEINENLLNANSRKSNANYRE